jgi:hypothetical protein
MKILHDGRNIKNQVPGNLIPFGWTPDGKQILVLVFGGDNISRIAYVSAADGLIRYDKALSLRGRPSSSGIM